MTDAEYICEYLEVVSSTSTGKLGFLRNYDRLVKYNTGLTNPEAKPIESSLLWWCSR